MRTIALASALALVGGLSLAAPAFAGFYDEDGVYHETASDLYKSADQDDLMSPAEIRAALSSQGYQYIRGLEVVGDDYSAIAYIDGDWVRVTVDGNTGDVVDTDGV